MKNAVIALGSNLADPMHQVRTALHDIGRLPHTRLLHVSSLYRTRPVGYADQPDFINAVCVVATQQSSWDLLAALQQLEARYGRERSFRNAPRTLDLDIIDYQGEVCTDTALTIPHPRAHERAFVMQPLAEIAPDWLIRGISAQAWAATLPADGIERLITPSASI